jgi:hypothetical protein
VEGLACSQGRLSKSAERTRSLDSSLDQLFHLKSMSPRRCGFSERDSPTILLAEGMTMNPCIGPLPSKGKEKAPLVTKLSNDSDDDEDVKVIDPPIGPRDSFPEPIPEWLSTPVVDISADEVALDPSNEEILEQLSADQAIAPVEREDHLPKVYRISALHSLLQVWGQSKLSRFVKRKIFASRQVNCLPPHYNGDIIFELLPNKDDAKKGDRVQSMERARDCYYWTQIVPTLALVPTTYIVVIFGSLARCDARGPKRSLSILRKRSSRNQSAWTGIYKMATVHKVDRLVEAGGLVCSFCKEKPYCTATCPASMFYMYPKTILPDDDY